MLVDVGAKIAGSRRVSGIRDMKKLGACES